MLLLPTHIYVDMYMDTHSGTGTHEPPTMHTHDAHLSGSDVRPEHPSRSSVVRAVRSPSLRASERQLHSAEGDGGGGNRDDGDPGDDAGDWCVYAAIYM